MKGLTVITVSQYKNQKNKKTLSLISYHQSNQGNFSHANSSIVLCYHPQYKILKSNALNYREIGVAPDSNGIYTSLLSVGRYPALIWQSPMNAMYWLESRIVQGKVIIHPADTGVFRCYTFKCAFSNTRIITKAQLASIWEVSS